MIDLLKFPHNLSIISLINTFVLYSMGSDNNITHFHSNIHDINAVLTAKYAL